MKNVCLKYAKHMLAGVVLISAGALFAYDVTIINLTDGEIVATVVEALCQDQDIRIGAGQRGTVNTGACCTGRIVARGTSGSIQGKEAQATPPVTGFGISCRGFTMIVKQTADGNMVIEQG